MLERYSLVSQVPGAKPYTMQAYSGTDLTQVLGINQARMPDGSFGWIQECGEACIRISGQTQEAYADFRPNCAKRDLSLSKEPTEESCGRSPKLPPGGFGDEDLDHQKRQRLSELPPLLIEVGPYCALLRKARDVFVDGDFYTCVVMCGVSLEKFQRDKAKPHGAERKGIREIRKLLKKRKVLAPKTLKLCKNMAGLRDDYAHGHGSKPREDALKALDWMHRFINNETNLMRDYVIEDGMLYRKPTSQSEGSAPDPRTVRLRECEDGHY